MASFIYDGEWAEQRSYRRLEEWDMVAYSAMLICINFAQHILDKVKFKEQNKSIAT